MILRICISSSLQQICNRQCIAVACSNHQRSVSALIHSDIYVSVCDIRVASDQWWHYWHLSLPRYQLLCPPDMPPLRNSLPLQPMSMKCILSDAPQVYMTYVRLFTWNFDAAHSILCLYICSSLHQIFNHRQMILICSIHQWSESILIRSHVDTSVCEVCVVSH